MNQYIDSQQHWEDSVNDYYDQMEQEEIKQQKMIEEEMYKQSEEEQK